MNVFTYELDGNLYINLTNRCSNDCTFCVRNGKTSYYGNELWLDSEPSAEEVIAAIPDKPYREVVFCGFGEPTFKVDEMVSVAKYLKEKGYNTRLNTNGHGNLINGEDITPRLVGLIDSVNVSMNAPDADKYFDLCYPIFGTDAFDEMLSFAKLCKKRGIAVNFSVVDCIGENQVGKCAALAAKAGIPLKVRKTIEDS